MRNYTVVTPLRRNGKKIAPEETVAMPEAEGDPLVAIFALERGDAVVVAAKSPPPTPPAGSQSQVGASEPLDGKSADELRAIAKAEGVKLVPNVKDPAKIAQAIEKARAAKAGA